MSAKKTDIANIREIAKAFLYLEPEVNPDIPLFIEHPYFTNRVIMTKENDLVDFIEHPEALDRVREEIIKQIDEGDLITMFCLMQDKYHLAFLKHIKQYMSKRDFTKRLAEAWIGSENPNQDNNVSINELIRWFKQTDRNFLMSKEEREYFDSLPEIVEIYRGVAVGRAEQKGLSWTCNHDTAKWFSERFNRGEEKGYILKGKIHKEDIFAYFNGRNEDEICCDSSKVFDVSKEQ